MSPILAALVIAAPIGQSSLDLHPIDDVWAYPHASEPDKDAYLRVWGYDGVSVAGNATESESFGYSMVKFDLAGVPVEKSLKSAMLVLVHIPKPLFDLDMAKKNPLEARPVNAGFTEKTWSYGDLSKFMPAAGKDNLYGTGAPEAFDPEKEFPIKIDLLKGPRKLADDLRAAKGSFAIALTTTMTPSEEARSTYKLYSKDGPKEHRPVLKLVFEG